VLIEYLISQCLIAPWRPLLEFEIASRDRLKIEGVKSAQTDSIINIGLNRRICPSVSASWQYRAESMISDGL
jgi:hypothetical protein